MSRYDPALVATFLLVLDLCGTFVFALSGAMSGVKHRLDLFGVLVLSFAAGTAGGLIRDVLLGAEPPPAIRDWRYIGVTLLAGLVTFRWSPIISRLRSSVLVLDAAGLGLFAVSGALKALAFQLNPVASVVVGIVTGVGDGVARDVLVSEVPEIMRSELYAAAALAGAAVVVVGRQLQFPTPAVAVAPPARRKPKTASGLPPGGRPARGASAHQGGRAGSRAAFG